ncbi:hypothetical protein RF142_07185, partial [Escherichia coli]|uniref:hypothetical protein n=1 Tax=Escherichia coli TaxID=562 RepID=UPI00281331C6
AQKPPQIPRGEFKSLSEIPDVPEQPTVEAPITQPTSDEQLQRMRSDLESDEFTPQNEQPPPLPQEPQDDSRFADPATVISELRN